MAIPSFKNNGLRLEKWLFGDQSIGKRTSQQDCFHFEIQDEAQPESDALLIVADGMGGAVGGEVASKLAIEAFTAHFVSPDAERRPAARLNGALLAANQALAQKIEQEPDLGGMGTTLVGVLKQGEKMLWISVGDSHLYVWRKGKIWKLNEDHSYMGVLQKQVKAGKISQADAEADPRRNALRSALMGGDITMVDTNAAHLAIDDIVILATDGLDTLSNEQLCLLCNENPRDTDALVRGLLNAVEMAARPRQDNTTILAYRHRSESSIIRPGSAPSLKDKIARKPVIWLAAVAVILATCVALYVWLARENAPQDPTMPSELGNEPFSIPINRRPTQASEEAQPESNPPQNAEAEADRGANGGGSGQSSNAGSDGSNGGSGVGGGGVSANAADGTGASTIEDEGETK